MEILAYILFGVCFICAVICGVANQNIQDDRKRLEKFKDNEKKEKEIKKEIKSNKKTFCIALVIAILCFGGGAVCAVLDGSSSSSNLSDEEKEWYKNNKDTIDNALDAADRYKGY